MYSALAYFSVGPMELMILGLVVLLLFGNRLPSVMRSLGRGVVEFKKGISGIEEAIEEGARNSSSKESVEEPPKPKPAEQTTEKAETS